MSEALRCKTHGHDHPATVDAAIAYSLQQSEPCEYEPPQADDLLDEMARTLHEHTRMARSRSWEALPEDGTGITKNLWRSAVSMAILPTKMVCGETMKIVIDLARPENQNYVSTHDLDSEGKITLDGVFVVDSYEDDGTFKDFWQKWTEQAEGRDT